MRSGSVEANSPNRYYDKKFQTEAVKILPGEYFVTRYPTMIVTVLGSCVSVCLYDKKLNIGGMNHFLLPEDLSTDTNVWSESGRYGVYAMELLINQLIKLGSDRTQLVAKVFGGANLFQTIKANSVGQRNVEFIREFLACEKIPILAEDMLDIYPRKVYFFPQNGKVLLKKLRSLNNSTILDRENEYRVNVGYAPKSGSVDLFE